ncbi:MAG: hypothetical protein WC441_02670 [Patescibacteria group bacterium]
MPSKKDLSSLKVQKKSSSSLADFIERPVPNEQEVANFNRLVKQEARDQEIDTNLSEIYRDRDGSLVDVKTLKVRRRRSVWGRLWRRFLSLVLLFALVYGLYYFISRRSTSAALDFNIQAPEKIMSGEEFFYEIAYRNTGRFILKNISLNLQYPDNFVFIESSEAASNQKDSWQLPDLGPNQSYSLKIKGKLINKQDAPNILNARLAYTPENFSSEFKKETSVNTLISGLGFEVEANYLNTALIGQIGEVRLTFTNFGEQVYLNDFLLNISAPENISLTDLAKSEEKNAPISDNQGPPPLALNKISGTQWQISGAVPKSSKQNLILKYQVKEKLEDQQSIMIALEQLTPDGRNLIFWEKSLDLQIMKSDLNLTLAVNGVKADSPVNFGQTLNYEIEYSNLGASTLNDVNIRLDLQGEFFDWSSLQDEQRGQKSGAGLVWTKEQLPALSALDPGQSGKIAFSIKLKDFQSSDLGKDLSLNSQARFNLSSGTDEASSDRQSNAIINRLNSNFDLSEQIRYFDENNIPVGSGPLPPKVGAKTSFRVYWTVSNSLHELSGSKVSVTLPAYVNFEEKSSLDTGSLIYDPNNRRLTWEIGRLPLSARRASAAFNISIQPGNDDLDKILILSPGTTAEALDIETQGQITKLISAKTTKLEDDDIANLNNSGQVGN